MKLYKIRYNYDGESGVELVVAKDNETPDDIFRKIANGHYKGKSSLYFECPAMLYSLGATEIKEVDGHKIIVV